MDIAYVTLIHVLISLVGLAAGFGWLGAWLSGRSSPGWTWTFLVFTILTSATGFLFPITGFTPGIGFALVSLPLLGVAVYALRVRSLAGGWSTVFVVCGLVAQYLNVVVLIVQLFQKMPVLAALAPTQSEPPFAATQGAVLLTFIALGIAAIRRRPAPG